MKAYILSIAGAIILSAVVSMIIPNGKLGSFIRGMTKLLIITVIVTPLVSWLKDGDFDFAVSNMLLDEDYLIVCRSMVSDEEEAAIEEYLSEEFSITVKAEATVGDGYSIKKITVIIIDFGINGQKEHIDIIRLAQETLEEKYGCEVEVYDEG